jgi:Flp pilus assembly protein TadG
VQLDGDDRDLGAAMSSLHRAGQRSRGRGRRSQGQGLVEFALMAPIMIFLVVAAVDLGRAVVGWNTIANAARHGSRVAAVNQLNPPDTVTSCNEDMPIEHLDEPHWSARACTAFYAITMDVDPGDVNLTYAPPSDDTITCAVDNLHVGCIATISVSATWQAITPIMASIVGPIELTATSEQPVERVFP